MPPSSGSLPRPQPATGSADSDEARRQHLGEHAVEPIQSPGQVNITHAGQHGRSVIHQDLQPQMITMWPRRTGFRPRDRDGAAGPGGSPQSAETHATSLRPGRLHSLLTDGSRHER